MTEAITTAQDREKWRNIVSAATAVREAECSDRQQFKQNSFGPPSMKQPTSVYLSFSPSSFLLYIFIKHYRLKRAFIDDWYEQQAMKTACSEPLKSNASPQLKINKAEWFQEWIEVSKNKKNIRKPPSHNLNNLFSSKVTQQEMKIKKLSQQGLDAS